MNALSFVLDVTDEILWIAQVLVDQLQKCPYEVILVLRSEFSPQFYRRLLHQHTQLNTKAAVVSAIKRAVGSGSINSSKFKPNLDLKLKYAGILSFMTNCPKFKQASCQSAFYLLYELCPSVQDSVTKFMLKREQQRGFIYLQVLHVLYESLNAEKKREYARAIFASLMDQMKGKERDLLQDSLVNSLCSCAAADTAKSYETVRVKLNGEVWKHSLRAVKAACLNNEKLDRDWQPDLAAKDRDVEEIDEVDLSSSKRRVETSVRSAQPSPLQRSLSMASKSTRASNDKLEIEDDVRSVRSDSTAEYPEEPVRRGSEGPKSTAQTVVRSRRSSITSTGEQETDGESMEATTRVTQRKSGETIGSSSDLAGEKRERDDLDSRAAAVLAFFDRQGKKPRTVSEPSQPEVKEPEVEREEGEIASEAEEEAVVESSRRDARKKWGKRKDELLLAVMKLRARGDTPYAEQLFQFINRTEEECQQRYKELQQLHENADSS